MQVKRIQMFTILFSCFLQSKKMGGKKRKCRSKNRNKVYNFQTSNENKENSVNLTEGRKGEKQAKKESIWKGLKNIIYLSQTPKCK